MNAHERTTDWPPQQNEAVKILGICLGNKRGRQPRAQGRVGCINVRLHLPGIWPNQTSPYQRADRAERSLSKGTNIGYE